MATKSSLKVAPDLIAAVSANGGHELWLHGKLHSRDALKSQDKHRPD